MENQEQPRGVPVKEFAAGNVVATVWLNKPLNGELFLKVSFRRRQKSSSGAVSYRTSFFPQDLADLHGVIVDTVNWLREAGPVLFHGGNGARPAAKKRRRREKRPV